MLRNRTRNTGFSQSDTDEAADIAGSASSHCQRNAQAIASPASYSGGALCLTGGAFLLPLQQA